MVVYTVKSRMAWNAIARRLLEVSNYKAFLSYDKSEVYLDYTFRCEQDCPLWWISYSFDDDYENWYQSACYDGNKREQIRALAYCLRRRFEDWIEKEE